LENNINSVELAKVLVGYFEDFNAFSHPSIGPQKKGEFSPLKTTSPTPPKISLVPRRSLPPFACKPSGIQAKKILSYLIDAG
jgi:hypothetical protein